jgi:hypothetical protein
MEQKSISKGKKVTTPSAGQYGSAKYIFKNVNLSCSNTASACFS